MLPYRVLRRYLYAAEGSKPKRMVVMIGPPAAGKGFFLGEPEKYDEKDVAKGKAKPEEVGKAKKYKTDKGGERDTTFGYKLPKMLVDDEGKPLITDDDIPDKPDYDESDNHLRAIQKNEAVGHYRALAAAKAKGKEAFQKALDDHWYDTKDGKKVSLKDHVSFDEFPDSEDEFFKKTNRDFYVSMRGWHDDAKQKNEETGKPKERFKDEARHKFDDHVSELMTKGESGLMIVDSAGEDIDAQDFKGQIEDAKASGYEVTIVFLHPEKADTELSNLARNRVNGKRMVDQADIDNWYKNNESALKAIQDAAPDNFVHYRKPPPDPDPAKANEKRKRARELMEKLKDMSKEEKDKATAEIMGTLYGAAYKMQPETSFGVLGKMKHKKPAKNIAKAVEELNAEAEKRSGGKGKAEEDEKGEGKGKEKKDQGSEKTRGKFLETMGDRLVRNPNPKGHKDQVKLRSLPWEHQKRFYQEWAAKQARTMTLRVAARWKELDMVRNAAEEEKKEEQKEGGDWLSDWMSNLAKRIEKEVKCDEYELSAKSGGRSPVIRVTLKGGEGDTSTAKKLKPKIEKIMEETTKENNKSTWKDFRFTVRPVTKGEDLILVCEVIFP